MKITLYPISLLLLVVCSVFPMSVCAATARAVDTSDDFELLMAKIRDDFARNPSNQSIDEAIGTYNDADGSFTDVDYSSIQRTLWPPLVHLERLYDFAFAYTNPKNKYYKDAALFGRIQKGLEFWHERNPWCHNWWYNQIAEPQNLGILLIQMRAGEKQLPAELEKNLLARIEKDGGHPAKFTGANRTDIALHWIYRSCLAQNETDLKVALESAYSPLAYTTLEGFQHDNSYFQHGVQLYIGGYGDELLKGVTQVAMYTKGTQYEIPQDKLSLLSKFMRETYYSTIRGQYMLFDVLGRGVSRPGVTKKTNTIPFAQRMVELDPAHADEFRAIVARLSGAESADYAVKPQHTHYFRGDYTLHVRPKYTFDVRMVSNRTMRCEYGNGENLKTYFMSDGCTNLVVDGNEYANIFPVWNWACIPGVTAPQLSEIPMAKSDWQTRGTSTFAGGVSDSIYGASAYSYMDQHGGVCTGAKKAWFFFDKEVVCLGAGIQSTAVAPVFTTINQCLLSEKGVIRSSEWMLHNQIGYLFPQGGNVVMTNQTQTGNWYDINHSTSKEMQQAEVFTLGFDHGTNPVNANYAYIVVPGTQTEKEMRVYQKTTPIEILSNTEDLQVVRNSDLGIWQLVFYRAGEFKNKEITVKVDKGCIVMVRDVDKQEASVHVADPEQTESIIHVTIRLPKKSKEVKSVSCDFSNSGVYAGASQAHSLRF